ncbi:MAG: hypothetical protein LKG27_00175 [Clostridiaceae bacterium]|nr:hypothetical protein [Clostridiaceae bacterium]
MTKLKIYQKTPIKAFCVVLVLMSILIVAGYLAFSGTISDVELKNSILRFFVGAMIISVPGIFVFIISIFDKTEYVSEINIYDSSIKIVYRSGFRISRVKELYLADIKEVKVAVYISKYVKYSINFRGNEGKESVIVRYDGASDKAIGLNPQNCLYKLFDVQNQLPNFTLKIVGRKHPDIVADLKNYYKTQIHTKDATNNNKVILEIILRIIVMPLSLILIALVFYILMLHSI